MPRLTIGKYHTSEDDCIIPAEFRISFDNVDRDQFEGVFGKYRVLYVDYDVNDLFVRVPPESKYLPAASVEIGKIVDYACLLEGGEMEICEHGALRPEDLLKGLRRPATRSAAKTSEASVDVKEAHDIPEPLQYEEYDEIRLTGEDDESVFDEILSGFSEDSTVPEVEAEDFLPDYAEIPVDEFPELTDEDIPVPSGAEDLEDFIPSDELEDEFPDLTDEEIPVPSEAEDLEDFILSDELEDEFPDLTDEELFITADNEDFEHDAGHLEGAVPDFVEEPRIQVVDYAEKIEDIPLSGGESPTFEISDEFEGLEELVEKSDIKSLLEEGEILLSEAEYDVSESKFRSVLEQDPVNYHAITGLVKTLYESGRPEEACEAYMDSVTMVSPGSDLCINAGRAFEALSRIDEACECYRIVLEADPADISIIERYAGLLINAGRYTEAVNILDKSVLDEYGSADMWIKRGDICVLAERTADALESYKTALQKSPENMVAALSMIRLLKENERFREASELLDSFIKIHPDDSHLWFEKGWVSEKSGKNDEALLDYNQAISLDAGCAKAVACKALVLMREKRPEEALECYDLLIRRRPDNPAVHHSRGLVLKVMGRYDEALTSFAEAIKLDPSDTDTMLESADLLLETGRFEDALGYFNKLAEAGILAPEVMKGKGDAYRALGMNEEALDAYEMAVEAGGDISGALEGKAEILFASERYEEAEEAYLSLLEIKPLETGALSGLASLYENTGQPELAISAYDSLLSVSPGDISALHSKLNNLLALERYAESLHVYDSLLVIHPDETGLIAGKAASLARLGKKEEAIVLYSAALEINPGSVEYLLELVTLLSETGRYEECLPYYDRLISIAPGETGFLMSKALALFSLKRYKEAVDVFEEVLLIHPNDPEALLHTGLALIRLGDSRGAMEYYKRSIDIEPDFGEEWARRGIDASYFISWEIERIQKESEASAQMASPAKNSELRSGKKKFKETPQKKKKIPYPEEIPEEGGYEQDIRMPTEEQLNNPDYLYKKGLALTRKGYYRAALKCFDRVESISKDNYEAIFSKGIIYAKNGYYDEAIECFDQVIEMNPSHVKAQKARKMAMMKKKDNS
ncbi:MAG: tetratricopeptide repeat protein [Methanomicrobiaceae archaeon]|nr:tetratricopeptide repeat protein [Methanomicrobiaceae archaeon]